MRFSNSATVAAFVAVLIGASGCCFQSREMDLCRNGLCQLPPTDPGCGPQQLRPADACLDPDCDNRATEFASPLDIDESVLTSGNMLPMSLEECINQALATSSVMRDLGGTIIRAPGTVPTRLDPALAYTDPRSGEEAALSAFDANFFMLSSLEDNARRLNNQFFGDQGFFRQDLWINQLGFNKRSSTGGIYSFRNVTTMDDNNQLSNQLGPRSWETYFESEVRQPLLQGAGTQFNRIAGPGASPGQLNGVLLARVRTDVSLIDFERSVRDLVAEVENSYWDLYYAYRDLEAKIQARDIAEETWAYWQGREKDFGRDRVDQAREQVDRFQSEVLDALHGRPIDGTRTNNGSSGGTFRGAGGIRVAERKLRLLIGLPINDGRLIQPLDSPAAAPVMFDWQNSISVAMERREELRRQRWIIKQRELELVANENFLKPQLDLVSRVRSRGFGQNLFDNNDGAANSLYTGDLHEWQLGVEYNLPVGFRRAHAAVRNSELALAREAELLREQERLVHYGLSNAVSECRRAFDNMVLQERRLDSIVAQLNTLNEKKDGGAPELDVELETHRRLLDARLRYHQAQIEYQLALRNVHFEKGTLLEFNSIQLTESVAPVNAIEQAGVRTSLQDPGKQPARRDPVISTGSGPVSESGGGMDYDFMIDGSTGTPEPAPSGLQ